MMNVIAATKYTLKNLILFLEQIEAEAYSKRLVLLNESTLGEHIRHILEFYQCLFSQHHQRNINYDYRERNRSIQEVPNNAIRVIHEILCMLDSTNLNKELQLIVSYDTATNLTDEMPTNMKREITYCLEHAIHHMALIKVGVKIYFSHINLPADFGVAPSTIKHQQRQCAQ